jgi:hypothetical protein
MAFTEGEIAAHMKVLEDCFWSHRRPPLHVRDQLREGQRFKNRSIELFFVRPAFQRPSEFVEEPIAKVQHMLARNVWRIFWMRCDLKWHAYPSCPQVPSLAKALRVIHEDVSCCFFG